VVFKEPARPALIKMKYHNEIGLGEVLAWNVGTYLDELGWQADALIPVPLSEQRYSERGYNQVDLIAHPLARLTGWRYLPDALHRVRHTPSQVGLAGWERRKNVLGAFCAEAGKVKEKTILLLDDVATTGATLNSAASSLMDAGAKQVYALTFAKALPRYGADHEKYLLARPLS
jgi:ComF family protein